MIVLMNKAGNKMTIHNNVKLAQDNLRQKEKEHDAAVDVLASAQAALDQAAQNYSNSLSQGREAALAARRVHSDAEVDRDIAKHCLEQARDHVRSARETASSAENTRLCLEANDIISRYHATLERELKAMSSSARLIMKHWAEATIARENTLSVGISETDILSVDNIRDIDSVPKEIIETKRVQRWINPWTGGPISEEATKKVVVLQGHAFSGDIKLSHQAEFDLNVYFDYERGYKSGNIAEEISIPSLKANGIPGWIAPKFITPQSVLEQLDTLENTTKSKDKIIRERKIELVPIAQK